jgi:hypothetical protein
VVTPDCFVETADGSSLYPTEGYCLTVYSSSTLSMLKIVIFFYLLVFFYRVFFTSKKYALNRVKYLITGILLSIEGLRMLKISFKPCTGSWGLILGRSASFGSFSTSDDPDPACAVFIRGVCTVRCSDTLGGDASLFDGVVLRLDNISVKASIAAFNLLPLLRKWFCRRWVLQCLC